MEGQWKNDVGRIIEGPYIGEGGKPIEPFAEFRIHVITGQINIGSYKI